MNSAKVCCLLLMVCFTCGAWSRPSLMKQTRKPVSYQLPSFKFPGSSQPDPPARDPAVQAPEVGHAKQSDPQHLSHHNGQDQGTPTTQPTGNTLLDNDPEVHSKFLQARSTLAPSGQTHPSESVESASTGEPQDASGEDSSEERLSPRQISPEADPQDGNPPEDASQRTSKKSKAFLNRLTKLRIQNLYSSEFDMNKLLRSLLFDVAVPKIFEVQMAALFA